MSPKTKPAVRKFRWVYALMLAVPACIVLYCAAHSSTPQGSYYDPDLGTVGNTYWEFRAGKIFLRTPRSEDLQGAYVSTGGVWLAEGGRCVLRPSPFGIALVDPEDRLPNRFLFRRGLGWVADFRNWMRDLTTNGR